MKTRIGRIRSKFYCVLWLLTHGFIPQKYDYYRVFKFKGVTHTAFSYDKFKECGKRFALKNYSGKTWSNGIWDFPEQLIKFDKAYKKTIAFDFDGVIHKYSKGWCKGEIYDSISKEWISLVNQLLSDGCNVIILTTRPKRQIYNHFWKEFHCYEAMKPDTKTDDDFSTGFAFRIMPVWEKFFNSKKDHKDYKNKTIGICNHKAVFNVLIDDRCICFTGEYDGLKEKIDNFKSWV